MTFMVQGKLKSTYGVQSLRVDALIGNIINSGALRKNYEDVLVNTVRVWESYLDEDSVIEMVTVLSEAGKRVMSGKASRVDSTATLIMAMLKNKKSCLSSADAIRVLEVFGIMFKCGGMVMSAIKNTYSTREMKMVLDKIMYEYQEMSRWRRTHGEGTQEEVVYAARLFNVA